MADLNYCPHCGDADGHHDNPRCPAYPSYLERIEASKARYRMAHAFQRLANALNVQLLPTDEDCVCLERLASQAEFLKVITHDFESPASREVIIEDDLSERLAEELAGEREDEERHD